MSEQKAMLYNTFQNWRSYIDEFGNNYPQVDDILIMGFEI